MISRFIFLIFILIFRFSLGWLETMKYPQGSVIKVTGNIDNKYQNDANCIIVMGRFWIDYRSPCTFSPSTKIEVIGKVNSGVIDKMLGRLWLNSAKLADLGVEDKSSDPGHNLGSYFTAVRENIVNTYRRFLPEPESGLVAGIVLGYKNDIGQEMYDLMVNSGTIHIAVASGYNIMLVGGTVLSICFWFLRRKKASVVAVLVMLIYALEAGGEPPVMRAVVMAGVAFWAAAAGRRTISWWVLLVAGWLMVLVEPMLLISISFQLSMAASIGLMVVEPWLSELLSKKHESLVEILSGSGILTSVSTMVLTAPIIWWNFGRLSWIGMVSNLLILPLVPLLMICGAFMQVLPWVFVYPTYALAHWMVEVIRFFGV